MDEKHYLSPLFEPRSVAILGATEREGALGAVLLHNMQGAGYRGHLYPVNPKYSTIGGIACFHHISEVPEKVDLAVIATPASSVPALVEECAHAGVRCAVVLSAGFSESGAEGLYLEQQMLHTAKLHGMRILGPNSLGVARPWLGLNATLAEGSALPGSIGFVSQSGALCAAVLDYARANRLGFSCIVSLGVSAELDFGEVLDYLVSDYRTSAILVHVEGIRDARRFLSALRAAARVKPVMVLKAGRHPMASRAAQAHTGAITGDDAVFEAALRRSGVVRLKTLTQLYSNLKGLFWRIRPRGNRLAIITNGGGPGVMAADRAGDLGIPLAQLSPESINRLGEILPPHWSRENPVDLVGEWEPDRYAQALSILLADDGVDGVVCLLAPLAQSHPNEVADRIVALRTQTDKPILTCWLGDDLCKQAREIFGSANIPTLRTPESAVDVFSHISSYYRNQQLLSQLPPPLSDDRPPDIRGAQAIIEQALSMRRTVLLRHEAMELLAAFHIPTIPLKVAHSSEEALEIAMSLGFPVSIRPNAPITGSRLQYGSSRENLASAVALHLACEKLHSELELRMPSAVEAGVCIESTHFNAYTRELSLRAWRDPVFGPVIGFGERSLDPSYWPDRAIALPPLNAFLVRDLMHDTRAFKLLGSLNGMPAANITAVENLMLRFSELLCELPWLRSIELDPLYVDDRDAVVVDARIEVGQIAHHHGRYEHMAIHPYPADLVSHWQLRDGSPVTIRPIKPEDAEMNQNFVRGLSAETKYLRFMSAMRELSPAMLAKLTQIDYHREIALIATTLSPGEKEEHMIGVCRYATNPDGASCEFAIVVADAHQRTGLGKHLMRTLIDIARQRGLRVMKGIFLANNDHMLRFVERLGFVLHSDPEDPTMKHGILSLAKVQKNA
ncbi:bifunctional acetyl coenzyme A synthetase (ADP forming), alpha domain/GNAT family N-acetyltransferase [Uliginosibacterium gangwonense]|uniref:bifunctional acetate--CoA ligase family protein/GNAT family N-acetyltransferase n=1 Tax=Uliginosibacterium gangwonense TaxID=392736 RepID=UPI000373C132|nr:bifunctional acetyl coenzyme A synthetase (ADP forming), alpha domain/GNAT family N-acetyltransferase [Uliginosibacterium gangwonense]